MKIDGLKSSVVRIVPAFLRHDEFSLLTVFYPSMQYIEITQAPKTSLIVLISNLGGSIGIFLGFSIFSLIEIVEIFKRMLYILCRHRSRVGVQVKKIVSTEKS